MCNNFSEQFIEDNHHQYELHVERKHAHAEGHAKGLAEGADTKAREMASAMLMDGDSVEKVVRISDLSESEVLDIKGKDH